MISLLSRHKLVLGFVGLMSFVALAAAFSSEIFLGLEPCHLCILQRYPFAVVMLVSIVTLSIFRKKNKAIRVSLMLCALVMLSNSGIALFHTGVEQGWWESTDSCELNLSIDDEQSWLENIMSTPMGKCSEIPWQDPVLGLSMANYNIALCFGLFLLCLMSAALKPRPLEEIIPTSE